MELSLFDREHRGHATSGGDRDHAVSARQAAEALFTPKPQTLKQPEVTPGSSANPSLRRPRVLGISAPESQRQEDVAPLRPATTHKRIVDAEASRVRTWLKYGMTVGQVAKVYGVTLMEVQRVLREG